MHTPTSASFVHPDWLEERHSKLSWNGNRHGGDKTALREQDCARARDMSRQKLKYKRRGWETCTSLCLWHRWMQERWRYLDTLKLRHQRLQSQHLERTDAEGKEPPNWNANMLYWSVSGQIFESKVDCNQDWGHLRTIGFTEPNKAVGAQLRCHNDLPCRDWDLTTLSHWVRSTTSLDYKCAEHVLFSIWCRLSKRDPACSSHGWIWTLEQGPKITSAIGRIQPQSPSKSAPSQNWPFERAADGVLQIRLEGKVVVQLAQLTRRCVVGTLPRITNRKMDWDRSES